MTKAPLHPQESERLSELKRLNILDTEMEERFDVITKLVSKTLNVPTALVSLVDANRQWFKSAQNIDFNETGRNVAFCAHAILEESNVLVITDATKDARFSNNPLVTSEPFVKAYAGVVLRSPEGLPLGTLCTFDYEPRFFDEAFLENLKQFAIIVETELYRNISGEFIPTSNKSLASGDGFESLMEKSDFIDAYSSLNENLETSQIYSFVISLPKISQISRSYGSDVADELLNKITQRAKIALKKWRFILGRDENKDVIGVVISPSSQDESSGLADQLREGIGHRIQTNISSISTPILIGFHFIDPKVCDLQSSLERSLIASNSLHFGVNETQTVFYAEGMGAIAKRRRKIANELETALKNDEFNLVYQPKVELNGACICGAEVLLRWTNKELGFVSPPEIFEAAAETGLINELEKWILKTAIGQSADWNKRELFKKPVSINLTGETLQTHNFVSYLKELTSTLQADPTQIELEILESAILHDLDNVIGIIKECQDLGFKFALDDFGTGQSSLHLLKTLPVDVLKIDRAFVTEIVNDPIESAIMHDIIDIGKSLKKDILAEGIENMAQYLILRSLGCDIIQGYYFSKPLSKEDFEALLIEQKGQIPPPGIEQI